MYNYYGSDFAMKKLLSLLMTVSIISALLAVGSIQSISAATQYEYEDNGNYAVANPVNLGDSIVGTNSSYNDDDYYLVTPSQNGKITVKFKHTYENSYYNWHVYLYMYNDGEYTKLSDSYIDLYDNEIVTMPYIGAVKGRKYYIVVSPNYSGVCGKSYTVSTSFSASEYYEKESNDIYAAANKIKLNKKYYGTINNSNDVDVYSVKPSDDGKITVQFKHTYENSYYNWKVQLFMYYKGEYSEQSSYYIDLDDNEIVTLPYIGAVKNRTYYIVVSPNYSGVVGKNYRINTSFTKSAYFEKENNDIYSTATTIKQKKTYSGIINNSSDYDYYKIKANKNGVANVKFKHKYKNEYGYWKVRIVAYHKGAYKELSSTYVYLRDSNTVKLPKFTVKKNRLYYICVDSYSSVVGINYGINAEINKK